MSFNPWTFLLELINFVVLAYVLHRLLYRPLHEAIERRRQSVRQTQEEAEKARAEAVVIKQELEARLAEMDRKRQEIISQAHNQIEIERKNSLDETERRVVQRQQEARRALASDREEMLEKLSGEIVTQAINLAERLLRQSADSTLQAQLEKHLIETLSGIPADQREQLQRDLKTEDTALLETARKTGDETLKQINETIISVVGKRLALSVVANPALIGGVRLRIGGHLWDASLAGQLEEARTTPRDASIRV